MGLLQTIPNCKTICASVTDIGGNEIRALAGLGSREVDVVFGGAPCQGFSLIGKRALDDPRNQLVFHYVRIVSELQPKYCVFENVKGLTLGKHSEFLNELITSLGHAGYDVALPYQVLNAADYGVPQDRKRLFLIGTKRGLKTPTYPEPQPKRVTVEEAIGDLPDANSFDELVKNDAVRTVWSTRSIYAKRLRDLESDPKNYGYNRAFERNMLTSSLRTEHSVLSQQRFAATAPGKTEPISRFRKLPPHGLCNTLRAGTDSARGAFTSPRPIHPDLPRVITVREAARLHSFPDWFRFHATKWHGFRQIGNSVPPLLGRAIASSIIQALNITPNKPKIILEQGKLPLLSFDMGAAAHYFDVPRDTIAQRTRKNVSTTLLMEEPYA